MPRADVHYALAIDAEIWEASRVDPSLLDPIVRVQALPAVAAPFVVVRDYQGPAGYVLERFVITDSSGREVYASTNRQMRLSGEHDEDRVVTKVRDVEVRRGDEHTVTFFVDDEEVASIPMFVEVGAGGDPAVAAAEAFKKAVGKGAIIWLVVPQAQPSRNGHGRWGRRARPPRQGLTPAERQQPAWFVPQDDKVYVFTGPTEQEIEGLTQAEEVEIVTRSKDLRSRISRVPASVRLIPSDDPLFDKIGQMGMGRRLNLPDGERALERWRANCALVELTPRFAEIYGRGGTAGGGVPADAAAAAAPQQAAGGTAPQAEAKKRPEDDIHVDAEIDQEVFDRLVADGKSERVARAKAKAAFVRKEKQRILAEQQGG